MAPRLEISEPYSGDIPNNLAVDSRKAQQDLIQQSQWQFWQKPIAIRHCNSLPSFKQKQPIPTFRIHSNLHIITIPRHWSTNAPKPHNNPNQHKKPIVKRTKTPTDYV